MNQFFSFDNMVNIILFITGYVISAIYSYWRNRIGRWVVVEKVSESFILAKPSEMKGENAIEILAGNKPIDSLVQTQFLLKNTGADITDPINITLHFKKQETGEATQVLGVKAREEYFIFTLGSLEFRKSFFNSSYAYKDVLNVLVYSEHPLTLQVKGSGIGWKAKYVDKIQKQARFKQVFTNSILSALGLERVSSKPLIQKEDSGDEVWLGLG